MKIIENIKYLFKKKTEENLSNLDYYDYDKKTLKFSDDTIYDYLVKSVKDDTDLYALNYFDTRITFAAMFRRINLIAKSLKYLGIKKGDIVTICMPNTPEAVEIFYAINRIGAVADMVHPLSSKKEIEHYLKESSSHILFLYDANYGKVRDIISNTNLYRVVLISVSESMPRIMKMAYGLSTSFRIERPKDDYRYLTWKDFLDLGYQFRTTIKVHSNSKDLAVILHSGGTTGTPKGVMISNYSFNALARQGSINVLGVEPKDKIVTVLPIFHGFGLGVCVHCPLTLKVEVILIPEFKERSFAKTIIKYSPQVIAGVPTLFEAMIYSSDFKKVDLSSLKYVISGGDNLPIEKEKEINEFLKNHASDIVLSKGYGMTESLAATIYTFPDSNVPGSLGKPMIGNLVKICRPNSEEEVETNEEGEICVNGPTIMMGYYGNKKESNDILKKHMDGLTWLHTGDSGYKDERGLIYFTGRLKRMIVSSGFNIYPTHIESVIMKHPKVKDCCAIGKPHPFKMQIVKVFVVLHEGFSSSSIIEAELRLLSKEHLSVFARPKEYEFIDALPKTLYKKTDYKKLERGEAEKYEETHRKR